MNAQALAETLMGEGYRVISGGTDTHVMLVDVFSRGILGSEAENALHEAGITVNKNAIPYDANPPLKPSGIRIGSPALTTRGMREPEMRTIAKWITQALDQRNDPQALRQHTRTGAGTGRELSALRLVTCTRNRRRRVRSLAFRRSIPGIVSANVPEIAFRVPAGKSLAAVTLLFQFEDHLGAGSLGLGIRSIAIAHHERDAAYLAPAQLIGHGSVLRIV